MDKVRSVSKRVNTSLFNLYSRGVFVPHSIGPDEIPFTSTPDSEVVLANVNALQDKDRLRELFRPFLDKEFRIGKFTRSAKPTKTYVSEFRFSCPHRKPSPYTLPPSPLMTTEEIRMYVWPNGALNRQELENASGSYAGTLWVDIGGDKIPLSNVGDGYIEESTTHEPEWKSVLHWPVMVGSNLCNVASLRNYLTDESEIEDPDTGDVTTMAARAQYLLDEVIKYEPYIPDGYFMVSGKMKRINCVDGLQMNMIYTIRDKKLMLSPNATITTEGKVSDDKTPAVGDIVAEVRSVSPTRGLSFHRMYYVYLDRAKKGLDADTFKLYRATAVLHIWDFKVPMNIFDIIRAYALIVHDIDGKQASDDLMDQISLFSSEDPEILRAAYITQAGTETQTDDALRERMRVLLPPMADIPMSESEEREIDLRTRMEKAFFPHCEGTDPRSTYEAKLRMLAMMFIELTATLFPGTKLGEHPVTDRKDFSFKRWKTPGILMRNYLRSFLVSRSIPLDREDVLLSMMKQNRWPERYTSDAYLDGVVDDVVKFNTVSMLDSIRTVKINAESSVNTAAVRRIHTSQWGAQCPANTPENANIGLNNNFAEGVLVSEDLTEDERDALFDILDNAEEDLGEDSVLLMVDGCPRGYVSASLYDELRQARQDGTISRGIGLATHALWQSDMWKGTKALVVNTSHGRPLIPLFRIDRQEEKLQDILDIEDADFEELLEEGLVEFVDSYELIWNVVCAQWLYERNRGGQFELIDSDKYTHSMIMPYHILSTTTNTLSYLEHNPAARGTYATVHSKQAMARPFVHMNERYEHELNFLRNTEPPLVTTETARRLGYKERGIGRNVHICCMSKDNNRDDAILFSESFAKSGALDGYHYGILTVSRAINEYNTYNWQLREDKDNTSAVEIREVRGLIDPDFSDSVVLPYGKPYIVEMEDVGDVNTVEHPETGQILYELEDGMLFLPWGKYRPVTVQYADGTERTIVPGKAPLDIPGKVRTGIVIGNMITRYALAAVTSDVAEEMREGKEPFGLGWRDSQFVSADPDMEVDDREWHIPVEAVVPRTLLPGGGDAIRGTLQVLYPKRAILRGDTAVRILNREGKSKASPILSIEKDKFEITYGYLEGIQRSAAGIKLKGAMPIMPKPGNKYAALYAQKNVNAGILPDSQMPYSEYMNEVTGETERLTFDIIFNPLSFPSRMTIGMLIEILIAGTVDYVYNLPNEDYGTVRGLYEADENEFNEYMEEKYGVEDAYALMQELTDSTAFLYDQQEKIEKCKEFRKQLGIPEDSYYDVFLPSPDGSQKVVNRIYCGTVYYVALRHLVDNKRRARGYVGKRNPMTMQPVKGRKRDGGANTGTMETDVYKSHGAIAMLHERMAKVSDAEILYKCPHCYSLASKISETEWQCPACEATLAPSEIIAQDTVWSYHLFGQYLKGLGIDLRETFA